MTNLEMALVVRRELGKRHTTYWKLIAKGRLTINEAVLRNNKLEVVLAVIDGESFDPITDSQALEELVREMNCRIAYYPRMVALGRISDQVATEQREAWRTVLLWYANRFTPSPLLWLKTKVKIVWLDEYPF